MVAGVPTSARCSAPSSDMPPLMCSAGTLAVAGRRCADSRRYRALRLFAAAAAGTAAAAEHGSAPSSRNSTHSARKIRRAAVLRENRSAIASPVGLQDRRRPTGLDSSQRVARIRVAAPTGETANRMRELFDEVYGQARLDPEEAVRKSTRGPQRKRFYTRAGFAEAPDGFAITLDDKTVRTPSRKTAGGADAPRSPRRSSADGTRSRTSSIR